MFHFSSKVTFQLLVKERWPMPRNMTEARCNFSLIMLDSFF